MRITNCAVRQDDHWNAIASGFLTGGVPLFATGAAWKQTTGGRTEWNSAELVSFLACHPN